MHDGPLGLETVSEGDAVPTFQLQRRPRLVGRRDVEPEPFHDLAGQADLAGVGARKLDRANPERILEAHAQVTPLATAMAAMGSWLRPAPSTDQR